MVEQFAVNEKVAGSSPASGAMNYLRKQLVGGNEFEGED